MIRKLLIILALCTPSFAAVCTSQAGGGNWDLSTAIWSCTHVPTTADSVVIASGNNITVESGLSTAKVTGITYSGSTPTLTVASGGTLNSGTMVLNGASVVFHGASGSTTALGTNTGTNLTTDVTVTLGTFTVDNGGNLNLTGTLKCGPTGTCNLNGHTIVTPNGGGVHQDIVCNSSSTGSTKLSLVGASHGSPAVLETVAGQSTGGNTILGTTAGSSTCDLTLTHVILNNIGDTTNSSIVATTQTTPGSFNATDVLLMHSGRVQVTTNSGVSNASTFSINGMDFRNVNDAGNILFALGSTNTTAPSAPRNVTNVTCDVEGFTGASPQSITVAGSYFNFGSSTLAPSSGASDTAGMNIFNCILNMTGINNSEQNWFVVQDEGTSSTQYTVLTTTYASANNWYNSVIYYHGLNNHLLSGTASSSVGNNSISYNLYDGDSWQPGDSGSFCMVQGTTTCSNNIGLNGNGNISNVIGMPSSLIMDNNLLWNQAGSSEGESVSNALQYTEYYDNLFPCPECKPDGTTFLPPAGNCNAYTSGANQESLWLTQTNFNEDYNWKFNFPNESDPSSITCVSVQGATFPFLGIFTGPNADYRGATSNLTNLTSTGATGTNCPGATCELDYATGGFTTGTTGDQTVQINDRLYNNTKNTWTTINTVSNTQVLLNQNTVGNMTVLASGDHFSIEKGIWADHSAIASATNRGLHDKHLDPVLYNPRVSICSWYNTIGGALSCPTNIAASGRTDTNILTVMHAAMTINGWDYGSAGSLTGTNCAAKCPAPVTAWGYTMTDLLKYTGTQYRVYNGQAKNAGHAGGDVGPAWLANYPPPAMQSF